MELWSLIVTIAGLAATPVLAFSYVPQVIGLFKTKSADGISLSFWFILDTALLFLFLLAVENFITTGSISLIVAQGLNLALALIVTAQVIYYKKK